MFGSLEASPEWVVGVDRSWVRSISSSDAVWRASRLLFTLAYLLPSAPEGSLGVGPRLLGGKGNREFDAGLGMNKFSITGSAAGVFVVTEWTVAVIDTGRSVSVPSQLVCTLFVFKSDDLVLLIPPRSCCKFRPIKEEVYPRANIEAEGSNPKSNRSVPASSWTNPFNLEESLRGISAAGTSVM